MCSVFFRVDAVFSQWHSTSDQFAQQALNNLHSNVCIVDLVQLCKLHFILTSVYTLYITLCWVGGDSACTAQTRIRLCSCKASLSSQVQTSQAGGGRMLTKCFCNFSQVRLVKCFCEYFAYLCIPHQSATSMVWCEYRKRKSHFCVF